MKPIRTILAASLVCATCTLPALAQNRVGYLLLEDPVIERESTAGLFGSTSGKHLRDLIATFDAIAENDDLDALLIRVKEMQLSMTHIEEIAPALARIRASGKPIHLFTENYDSLDFLLGANADELIMQSGGSATLTGLYMEELFLADMLQRFGIQPSFVQIGDYKGAEEMLANSEPSPQWNESINNLLDGIYNAMLQHLATGRRTTPAAIEKAMAELFFADGERAISTGMLDAEIDRLQLEDHLARRYGKDFVYDTDLWVTESDEAPDFANMGLFEAFSTIMRLLSEPPVPELDRDTIAILHIDGAIVDGESSPGGFFGGSTVGALTIRETLRELQNEDLIKGVIVRINSPGGSATASEAIWQGIKALREDGKPVWVSVGSMAASGGYYIAVAGERIYMNPSSIVGSIGVVSGKLAIDGLYEKLSINAVPRSRGPNSEMFSSLEPWNDQQRQLMRDRMKDIYDLFSSRVRQGRSGIDLSKAGEGRLFVAADAVELNMADAVGGIDRAITDLAVSLALEDGAFDVRDYPEPQSLEEILQETFGSASARSIGSELATGAIEQLGRQALGERAWSTLADHMEALLQLRDQPVVLAMPRVIIIR